MLVAARLQRASANAGPALLSMTVAAFRCSRYLSHPLRKPEIDMIIPDMHVPSSRHCSQLDSQSFILPVFARHHVPLENMAVGTRHTRIMHAARRTSFTRKRLPCQTMSARMNIAHLGNVRNE